MAMLRLPNAPKEYSDEDQAQLRRDLEAFARRPLSLYTENGTIATLDGTLIIKPQDTTIEGGEIQLVGAGVNRSWTFDNYTGTLRFHSGGTLYMSFAPDGTSLNQLYLNIARTDSTGLSLARQGANNWQIRSNDDGLGNQQDATRPSFAITTGEGGGDQVGIHRRAPAGVFTQLLACNLTGVANSMSLGLYDESAGGAPKRVSRGVVDSGGVGFRLLRVPN